MIFSCLKFRICSYCCSVAKPCPALCNPHKLQHARLPCPPLFLLKLMSIKSVMPSSHLILCRPLFFLPSIFPSIRVFSNESAVHIRLPKYWSFSFNISPVCFQLSTLPTRILQISPFGNLLIYQRINTVFC